MELCKQRHIGPRDRGEDFLGRPSRGHTSDQWLGGVVKA
jgi:hypothetical protein